MSYPWQQIKPKDQIRLRLEQVISNQDVHVLTTLYQPLIGTNAYALYMMLIGSIHSTSHWSDEQTLASFLQKLDVGIPDFYQARTRLEAFGLLKVFRGKENMELYVYDIHPPLTASDFFNDDMMRLLLFEKVGDRVYKTIREQYTSVKPSSEEFEEITKSFLDVISFNLQRHDQLSQFKQESKINSERAQSPRKTVTDNDEFDWDFFIKGLKPHFINRQSITEEIKELIYTFYAVYSLDELEIQQLILEATDLESGKVSKNKFIQVVHRSFHQQHPNGVEMGDTITSSIEEMNERMHLRRNELKQKGFTDEEIEIIEHAGQVKPGQYLNSIKQQKGGFVDSNEPYVLKELVEKSKLDTAVINILLNYILIIKNEPVLVKSYALKIANDWAQSDVRTPEDAMLKVKKLYSENIKKRQKRQSSKKQYNNYSKKVRKESLPDWAKEDKNIPSEEDDKVSPEVDQEFKERLRKIRERRGGNA